MQRAWPERPAAKRQEREAMSLIRGDVRVPVIGAANASAVAGGLELLLGCDLIVASSDARFGLPEVKRGLFAAGGGTFLGTRVPLAVALEIALTGDTIDAGRACALGLVNAVVPPRRGAAHGPWLRRADRRQRTARGGRDEGARPARRHRRGACRRAPARAAAGRVRQRGRQGGRDCVRGEARTGLAGPVSPRARQVEAAARSSSSSTPNDRNAIATAS
jgi:enoyl-CoA hydratase/carnithine racemase